MRRCESSEYESYYSQFLLKGRYQTDIEVSDFCIYDKHNYQSCGLQASDKIGTTEVLCNNIICYGLRSEIIYSMKLSYDTCKRTELDLCKPYALSLNRTLCYQLASAVRGIGTSEIQRKQCDMICQDTIDCIDEANCNGFQYGLFCRWQGKMRYIKTSLICDSNSECDDSSDERYCFSEGGIAESHSGCLASAKLFNYTRCGPLWSKEGKYKSHCLTFRDQYNCSDPDRGLLRCDKDTFPSTVSYGVLCRTSQALCDDEIDLKCQQTSEKCLLHKHLLCNHRADCQDGSDENRTECQNLHTSTCYRR